MLYIVSEYDYYVSYKLQQYSTHELLLDVTDDIRYSNGNYEFQEVAEEDEDDYPTAPVWERRKMFGQPISKKQGDK